MTDEWYSPAQIIFEKLQIIWVLEHWAILEEGSWPPEPSEYLGCEIIKVGRWRRVYRYKKSRSTYTDAPISMKGWKKGAYYEKPIEIIAEIAERLTLCGLDGNLVISHHRYGTEIGRLAIVAQMSEGEVGHRIKRALRYASGLGRKRVSYEDFVSHHYESRIRTLDTKCER